MSASMTTSTLSVPNISDGANSTSTTNCVRGSAKAWAQFDTTPTTPTISGSYNVSSITKVGTGVYYVNFTSSLGTTAYSFVALVGNASGSGLEYFAGGPRSATSAYWNTWTAGVGSQDFSLNGVVAFV